MKVSNRTVVIITAVLGVVAIICYAIPLAEPAEPVRVNMPNKAGAVVFAHQAHIGYGLECTDCHHTGKGMDGNYVSCGKCHGKKDDKEFYTREHSAEFFKWHAGTVGWKIKALSEDLHERHQDEDYCDSCQACHHDEDVEEEPTSCSSCHVKDGDAEDVALKTAVHAKCGECHGEPFDSGVTGCKNCHGGPAEKEYKGRTFTSCTECHEPKASPKRMAVLHGQCMGCHKKKNKGPFKNTSGDKEKNIKEEKDCGKCHRK